MDYGGWRPLNGRQAAYGLLIIGQPVGYRPYASSACDMNSASAVAVCGLRRYSVICLCLCHYNITAEREPIDLVDFCWLFGITDHSATASV